MSEQVHVQPLVQRISGLAEVARAADDELSATMFYAHRMIDPPMSLRVIARATGMSPSGVLGRIRDPRAAERAREMFDVETGGQRART